MAGLFDDEGKTAARGRKNKASDAAVAGLVAAHPDIEKQLHEARDKLARDEPEPMQSIERALPIEPGHPFESSIKAAKAIADDMPVVTRPQSFKSEPVEMVNRLPISNERRAKLLELVDHRTRYKAGKIEWRELRAMLKEFVDLL